ncbi:MAG: energy transducer TonB [Fluviicola sp.]|jgi:hypothetical protein
MKTLFILISIFISSTISAQVLSGSAVDAGRVCVTENPNFSIKGKVEGKLIVEVSIDWEGKVTGTKIIQEGTTVKSTPFQMYAVNASKKLKFTPGTKYDKFQLVRIQYNYIKETL